MTVGGAGGNDPTRFPSVVLRPDLRSLHLRRLDARDAVDSARQTDIAARHAVAAGRAGAGTAASRAAADLTSSVLRNTVALLQALDREIGAEVASLVVDVEVTGAVSVARPHGEIDLFSVPRLEAVLLGQLDLGVVALLVLDLSAVTFLDSSALAVMVEVDRVARQDDVRFALVRPTPRIRRILAITALDTVLEVL